MSKLGFQKLSPFFAFWFPPLAIKTKRIFFSLFSLRQIFDKIKNFGFFQLYKSLKKFSFQKIFQSPISKNYEKILFEVQIKQM